MLFVLSPAKTLDFASPLPVSDCTRPALLEHSAHLVDVLRELAVPQLASLMHVSDQIAALNVARMQDWHSDYAPPDARQAIFAFKGDVYTGLAVERWSSQDIAFAQQHLRILSGLYGVLRPLDLILPYRLEMGTKLVNSEGKDLYAFWGDLITQHVQAALQQQGDNVLINLASQEYFKAVRPRILQAEIITPVFKDWKGGRYKIISFYAKKARGMMASFAVQERLQKASQLKDFKIGGYRFDQRSSTASEWVFLRDAADAARSD
jgi:cytoplasmic iron level regulating protein YaaA (DUF328/UPF0246 family)